MQIITKIMDGKEMKILYKWGLVRSGRRRWEPIVMLKWALEVTHVKRGLGTKRSNSKF